MLYIHVFFKASYYRSVQRPTSVFSTDDSQNNSDRYEKDPQGLPVGIRIKHLR